MSRINVDISGMEKALENIEKYTVEKIEGVQNQTKESGETIVRKTKEKIPKDSGDTAESIEMELSNNGLLATIGPTKPKGWKFHFHEFGTVKIAATPSLTPSYEQEIQNYISSITSELKKT
ncbi:hypothetical protein BTR23_07450 [Alkalihalophilus pseudofirmus]|nr:hypothetical protein BTR23_07450 [Alkalihalophilus pseudofirmus]